MECIVSDGCCRSQPYRFPRHSVPVRTHPYNKFAGTCRFLAAAGFQIRICTDENGGYVNLERHLSRKAERKSLFSGPDHGLPRHSVPVRTHPYNKFAGKHQSLTSVQIRILRLLRGPAGQRLFRGANGSFSPSAKTVSSMM